MNETEAIDFMYNTFIEENRILSERAGMSAEEFDEKMAQGAESLKYMFGNVYTKMKESGIIA